MNTLFLKQLCLVVITSALTFPQLANAGIEIVPPAISYTDKFGVDLRTGQVTASLETVSIGGLSHTISTYSNELPVLGVHGYQDKYYGKINYIDFGLYALRPDKTRGFLDGISVYDMFSTARFVVKVNGVIIQVKDSQITSGYVYESLGDARDTLTVNGEFLDWTKADGTVSKYHRGANTPGANGNLEKVIYPNGFTITISPGLNGVTTNTGFHLKYDYVDDGQGGTSGWWKHNPKYITGMNLAVEKCISNPTLPCDTGWPKATFTWPAGMPSSMYTAFDSQYTERQKFSVKHPRGGTTEFTYKSYDITEQGAPSPRYSPRLVGIKPADSDQVVQSYSYITLFKTSYSSVGALWACGCDSLVQTAGVVSTAAKLGTGVGYSMMQPYGPTVKNFGNEKGGIYYAIFNLDYPVTLDTLSTVEGKTKFENSFRNFPTIFESNSGLQPSQNFEYDSRGNLTKVVNSEPLDPSASPAVNVPVFKQAEYPAACTSNTRNICNQAIWTKDFNADSTKRTDYEYHQGPDGVYTGLVSKITLPANQNGLRAQTRYGYEQKRASYYNESGLKTDGTPIWMKVSESICTNSTYNNGACSGGDEVITRYEYDNDNLLMTGMTVESKKDQKTLRTCYEYDKYGNQIGATKPNAGLSLCPSNRNLPL